MTDIGEERGLGAIDRGERFSPAALFRIRLRVREPRGDLTAEQFEKTSIRGVERTMRIEAGDEDRIGTVLTLQRDGNRQQAPRRQLPGAGRERLTRPIDARDVGRVAQPPERPRCVCIDRELDPRRGMSAVDGGHGHPARSDPRSSS